VPISDLAAFVGLDRSDQELDLCLYVPHSKEPEFSVIDNTPEQLAPWLESLSTRFQGAKVALCLEQPAGGLLYHFLHCDWLVVYAVNPMSLTRHRETLVTSRAKSDASDAYYLMDLVRQYHAHLPMRTFPYGSHKRRPFVPLQPWWNNAGSQGNRIRNGIDKGYEPFAELFCCCS